MAETEKRKRLSRDERQSSILDAAIRCAIRSGFRGASMDDIAREAAISVGVIYRHFSSKEAIIEAIVARGVAELQMKIAEIGNMSSDALRAGMLNDIHNFIERQHTREHSALRLEIYAEAARNPRVESILRAYTEAERDIGRQLFSRILPKIAPPEELTARADMLRIIADGLLVNGLYAGDNDQALAKVLQSVMSCLLAARTEQ
ncbi:MAG: TetR/AcrR family transcriptional regulator [Asticcacaulis sp.]|uniref:TetR/AcrR family transcriptional regulator n=1 Tax=Asticcacaulis sp. TaxID=1872648 RepID=UPI0039E5F7E5